MKIITPEVVKENLQPGDRVVIPSGLGGVHDARFESQADGRAKVTLLTKGHGFYGQRQTVNLEEIRVPEVWRNAAGTSLGVVRDSEKQYIAVQEPGSYRALFKLPTTTGYRDRAQFEKGVAAALGAKLYFEQMGRHIQKRVPDANLTALNAVLSQLENGTWVAPTAVESAAMQAGIRIDLTDWCDAEMMAPVPGQPDHCERQLQALQKAVKAMGVDANIQVSPDFEWQEHPIKTDGGVELATQLVQRYLAERGLADMIEVHTTDENDVAFILAADLAITVDRNQWHYDLLRPFSAKNEAWLGDKRSRFEHRKDVDPLGEDILAGAQNESQAPSL